MPIDWTWLRPNNSEIVIIDEYSATSAKQFAAVAVDNLGFKLTEPIVYLRGHDKIVRMYILNPSENNKKVGIAITAYIDNRIENIVDINTPID